VAVGTATLGPIKVQEQDAYGNPTTTAETVNLASSSSGTIEFATTSGGASVASISIPVGSSSANIYYGDTKAGTPTITVSGALASGTQVETITAGVASKVSITPAPSVTKKNPKTTVTLSLQLQDQFGNSATSSSGTTLGMSTASVNGFFGATLGSWWVQHDQCDICHWRGDSDDLLWRQ